MVLLPVDEALSRILHGVEPVARKETRDLVDAESCVTAKPIVAKLTQPPFDASAMDGYAVRRDDVGSTPVTLQVIGEAAAGHPFNGAVGSGEAVRIFTGAPLPRGADAVVIQENTTRDGERVSVETGMPDAGHVRPMGGDFRAGEELVANNRNITSRDILLAAAGGLNEIVVRSRPVVAIVATGDELVAPGLTPREGQIVSSNPYGLAALVRRAGGDPQLHGIARDTAEDLAAKIDACADADVIVTIGGASVGDHDLVVPALRASGFDIDFWKIAMRPGKPLFFGRRGHQCALGLPGNPVSSLICARVFLVPLIGALLGLAAAQETRRVGEISQPIPANGPRRHYMRAVAEACGPEKRITIVTPMENQDSSMMVTLARSNCLIVREPGAPALESGGRVEILDLDF